MYLFSFFFHSLMMTSAIGGRILRNEKQILNDHKCISDKVIISSQESHLKLSVFILDSQQVIQSSPEHQSLQNESTIYWPQIIPRCKNTFSVRSAINQYQSIFLTNLYTIELEYKHFEIISWWPTLSFREIKIKMTY